MAPALEVSPERIQTYRPWVIGAANASSRFGLSVEKVWVMASPMAVRMGSVVPSCCLIRWLGLESWCDNSWRIQLWRSV